MVHWPHLIAKRRKRGWYVIPKIDHHCFRVTWPGAFWALVDHVFVIMWSAKRSSMASLGAPVGSSIVCIGVYFLPHRYPLILSANCAFHISVRTYSELWRYTDPISQFYRHSRMDPGQAVDTPIWSFRNHRSLSLRWDSYLLSLCRLMAFSG